MFFKKLIAFNAAKNKIDTSKNFNSITFTA